MRLHDFVVRQRAELERRCLEGLRALAGEGDIDAEAHHRFVADYLDVLSAALQRREPFGEEDDILARARALAATRGEARQRSGCKITSLSRDFGAISDTVGELGAAQRLSFGAGDYKIFNLFIDEGIAAAIDAYDRHQRQALEQDERRASERLGFLSHELRNSLAAVKLAFVLIKQGTVTPNGRTGAVVDRGIARMERLIEQTLAATRLRAGVRPELRDVVVGELLHELVTEQSPERGVVIQLDPGEPGLRVMADEVLLASAVGNLLQNAIKFTRDRGHVHVRAHGEAEELVIEVEDECGGLPPGKSEELFAPFVQRARRKKGVGLGLAITREAAEAHGGRVSVHDLPGRGCIFEVRLPRRPPAA